MNEWILNSSTVETVSLNNLQSDTKNEHHVMNTSKERCYNKTNTCLSNTITFKKSGKSATCFSIKLSQDKAVYRNWKDSILHL